MFLFLVLKRFYYKTSGLSTVMAKYNDHSIKTDAMATSNEYPF